MTAQKQDASKHVYWVASYPRSGNTFTRMLLTSVMLHQDITFDRINRLIPEDIKGSPDNAETVATKFGSTIFMKTHAARLPSLDGRHGAGVYLHRYPLDSFLSGLNYLYINNVAHEFRGGLPKSVEAIHHDGELDWYFQRFLEVDGFRHFLPFAGRWSENVRQWCRLVEQDPEHFLLLPYERLSNDTEAALGSILLHLGVTIDKEVLRSRIALVGQEVEKEAFTGPSDGGSGAFFWKRQAGYHRSYLTEAQIAAFEEKHGSLLRSLGY